MASASPYTQLESSRTIKTSGSGFGHHTHDKHGADSGGPNTLYTKRKWLFTIAGVACCLALLLLVCLIVVPLVLLTKTRMVEQTPPTPSVSLEFFDLCTTKNPLRFGIWLKNPSWIGAAVESGTANVYRKLTKNTKSSLIASGDLPYLKLRPGVQFIDVTIPIDLNDPAAAGKMVNDMILQQNITLVVELKVKATAVGLTIPLTLPFEFTIPDPKKPKAPPAPVNQTVQMDELGFTRVDSTALEFALALRYNWSIDGIIVHLPPLNADVLYEGNFIANATVPAMTLSKGWVPITAMVFSPVAAANITSEVVQNLLTTKPFNLSITGAANGGQMCPNAAELLRQITFVLQLLKPEDAITTKKKQTTTTKEQKKIAISSVNITSIDSEAIEVRAKYELAGLPFPIKGVIPDVVLEYWSDVTNGAPRMGYLLASADIGQSIATLRVVCEQPMKLGRWISALFMPNQPAGTTTGTLTLLPRIADDVNIVTRLLSRWNYTQGLGSGNGGSNTATPAPSGDASVSLAFGINNVSVLGAKGPQNVVIGVSFALSNTLINMNVPSVTVAVDENLWSPGDAVKHPERLAVISTSPINVIASPNPVDYSLEFSLTTTMSLRETVDRLFQGGSGDTFRVYGGPVGDSQIAAMQSPDPLVQTHIIQRILSALEYRLGAAPSQGSSGAQVTAGGVMPKVAYNITATTNDTANASVWLNVSLPLPLPIHLGQLNIQIGYHAARLVSAKLINSDLLGGVNRIQVDLQLDATGANRAELESLISAYLFGKPVDSIVLKASLFDSETFRYAAINLTYPFNLPPKASGASGSSSPMPCIDTLALKPGVDLSAITRLQMPSCVINGQLGIWFKNPIPFPLRLNTLSLDAYFSDPDGLVGFPWAYIADAFPGQFDPITERLIFQVREPVGSSNLVVPCAPPDCYSKQLPVVFEPGETDTFLIVLRTDPLTDTADPGLWNTCIRLAEQKFNNKLNVNLRNVAVQAQLLNFVLNVAFELENVPVGSGPKPPCILQLGLQNTTIDPTRR